MPEKGKNDTMIFDEGYVAGYNQHRVDIGEITQGKADKILRRMKR